jgi:group I intron endonuclease
MLYKNADIINICMGHDIGVSTHFNTSGGINMNYYSIYKVTNRTNEKIYIGFSKNWKERQRRHKFIYQTIQNKFYNALRKYGWESFSWEEIYVSKDKDHCFLEMEQYFITLYDSIENGYNTIQGGSGTLGAVKDKVWINDGKNHRRVHPEFIPEGWILGRINLSRNIKMSPESKKSIGSKNRSHTLIKSKCPHCDRKFNAGNLVKHLRAYHC